MDINQLLQMTIQSQASDLHLLAGTPPMLRIDGSLNPIANQPPLEESVCKELVLSLMSAEQKELFLNQKDG